MPHDDANLATTDTSALDQGVDAPQAFDPYDWAEGWVSAEEIVRAILEAAGNDATANKAAIERLRNV